MIREKGSVGIGTIKVGVALTIGVVHFRGQGVQVRQGWWFECSSSVGYVGQLKGGKVCKYLLI
jgi:hypothetical protein